MANRGLYVIPAGAVLTPCPRCGVLIYRGPQHNQTGPPQYAVDPDRWPETRYPGRRYHGWGLRHLAQDCAARGQSVPVVPVVPVWAALSVTVGGRRRRKTNTA